MSLGELSLKSLSCRFLVIQHSLFDNGQCLTKWLLLVAKRIKMHYFFFLNSQILWLFLKELSCTFHLFGRFPAKPTFLVLQLWKNCGKLLMEYTLYLKPQFPESKKPKQNRVKSRKNDFVEIFLLNLLKGCVLLLQFLKIILFFLLCFPLHYKVTNRNTGPTDHF